MQELEKQLGRLVSPWYNDYVGLTNRDLWGMDIREYSYESLYSRISRESL